MSLGPTDVGSDGATIAGLSTYVEGMQLLDRGFCVAFKTCLRNGEPRIYAGCYGIQMTGPGQEAAALLYHEDDDVRAEAVAGLLLKAREDANKCDGVVA